MDISSFARCAAYAAFGFACGGVMFCRFMPLLLAKKDITKLSSDGNPGSANVFINCGIPLGLLCLFLDMFKGFLPVLLAEENYDVRRLSFAILIAAPGARSCGCSVRPFKGRQMHCNSFRRPACADSANKNRVPACRVVYTVFNCNQDFSESCAQHSNVCTVRNFCRRDAAFKTACAACNGMPAGFFNCNCETFKTLLLGRMCRRGQRRK